jgi:hypothetical protein
MKAYLVTVKVEVDDVRGEDLWDAIDGRYPVAERVQTQV